MSRLSDFVAKLGFNKPPAHEPAPAGLTATTYAEREAALREREREIGDHHDLIVKDLDRQRGEAGRARDAAIAEARELAEAQAAKADAEIATEVVERVYPLVRQLITGRDAAGALVPSRETAPELSRVWRELAGRVASEVGTGRGLAPEHLAFALLECLGGDIAARAASSPRFWDAGDSLRGAIHAASSAMLDDAPASVVEDALRRADVALAHHTRNSWCLRGASIDEERVQAHRSHACASRVMTAVHGVDAARAKLVEQKNIARADVASAWQDHDRDAAYAARFAGHTPPTPPRFSRDAESPDDVIEPAPRSESADDVDVNPDATVPASILGRADAGLFDDELA